MAAGALLLLVAGVLAAGAPDPVREAAKALESSSSMTRVGACRRLGALGERRAVPLLLRSLGDETAEVREAAVDALALLGDEVAVPHLARLLEDPSPTIRGRTLLALGKLAGKYVVPSVARHLEDRDAGVRVCAVRALGQLGDPLQAGAIRALLDRTTEDPDHVLLATAIVALTQLGGKEALPDLFERVGSADAHDSWLVRSSLVWAVAETGEQKRLPFVRRAFADRDERVAGAAAAALLRLGETEEVVAAVGDEDPVRRRLAVAALAETGDPRWKETLLGRSEDDDFRVRLEAVVGLSRMGVPEAFPALLEGLGSRSAMVWGACATELRRAYGQDFGRDREAWVGWYRENRERLRWDAADRRWQVGGG